MSLDQMVKVRCSAEELEAWRRASGGKLSGWLRSLANERAAGGDAVTVPSVEGSAPPVRAARSAGRGSGSGPVALAERLAAADRLSQERVASMAREAGLCPPHPSSSRILLGGGLARCRLCDEKYRL